MSHNPDSENVDRLWSDRPQPTGDACIIRCLWCFTLLMNLHDFVTESFNPEHISLDAHTVPFCLTTDHISTRLMMFSGRFKTAQFWSFLIRGEWKCSICSYQRRWCGVLARRTGVAASMESHGELSLDTGLVECLDSWQRMQWYAPSLSVSTAGNGCSGMHRLSVSLQLVTDAVVCNVSRCLDRWLWIQRNALDSRSSEVSVLISGRLRRMVSEVFGKHFGGLYSWSTMSSSSVSPCVASLSHCESFHCSCICMAQAPCLVTFVLFAPRFIHMSSISAWPLTGTSTEHASTHSGHLHVTENEETNVEKCRNMKNHEENVL